MSSIIVYLSLERDDIFVWIMLGYNFIQNLHLKQQFYNGEKKNTYKNVVLSKPHENSVK